MMTKKWIYGLGIALGVFGLWSRFWVFGQVPPSLNRDEAALGYNAFTIRTSGRDEWGEYLPLIFKSFGDYKLPGYIYLATLFNWWGGNTPGSIRIPSILSGLMIIGLTYGLILNWSGSRLQAVLAAGILASQPWSIFYSRMAYEAHLGLGWFILSLFCFGKKGRYGWLGGCLSYFLAVMTYNSPLLLVPLVVVYILKMGPRRTRVLALMGVGVVAITAWLIFTPLIQQKQNITIFSDLTLTMAQKEAYAQSGSIFSKLFNHRYSYWLRAAGYRMLTSLGPAFLVFKGGANPWHNVPNTGHILLTTYGLAIVGFMGGLRQWQKNWPYGLILAFGLLPAVVTVDAPHATRSLFFFYCLVLLAWWGLFKLPDKVKLAVLSLALWESLVYAKHYFVDFPKYQTMAWPVGLWTALGQAARQYGGVSVRIEDTAGADLTYDQIYIFPLYVYGINQAVYQQSRVELPQDAANLSRVGGFGGVSISGYNQIGVSALIERGNDGRYRLQ